MIRTNFKVRVLMNKSEDKVINVAVQLLTIEPDEELQRIDNYLRITIGTDEEMEKLFDFLERYLGK